jgi:hypothetical protein
MKQNNQTPTLKNQVWEPLYEATEALLGQLLNGQRTSFALSVGIAGYSPSPYVQGILSDDGDFLLEFSSNVFLEPDLDRLQRSQLDGLGWTKPNGKNPNYTKIILGTHPLPTTSRYLITTLRVVFDIPLNAWFTFGDSPKDLEVAESDNFWHKLDSVGVVCLQGQNAEGTIEGIS